MNGRQANLRRSNSYANAVVIAIVITLVGVGALLFFYARGRKIPTLYAAEIESARLAGIPVTAQALQGVIPPSERNAAPVYTKFAALLKAHPLTEDEKNASFAAVGLVPPERAIQRVRQLFKRRPELLRTIHQAAAYPECSFQRDWSYPAAVDYHERLPMQDAARLLRDQSMALTYEGHPGEAIRIQAQGFRIAQHMSAWKGMLGLMGAQDVDGMTIRCFRAILIRSGTDPAVASAVRTTIEREWRPRSLIRALQEHAGSNVLDLDCLRALGPGYLKSFLGNGSPGKVQMATRQWNDYIDDNGSVLLQRERRAIIAAGLHYWLSAPILHAIGRETMADVNPSHLVALTFGFEIELEAERQAETEAAAGITRSAAALLVWRSRHGAYPSNLAPAISPVPVDPFDGRPLRYRREGRGFVVYSIGTTGKSTGGTPTRKPGRYDILFRYPVPPYLKKRNTA